MKKLTNEQRKRYNQYVENKNQELAAANAIKPFLIIFMLILAFFIGGKIAIGLIGLALIISIIPRESNNSDFQK